MSIIQSDFPFRIMDVASLLRLNIRRSGGTRVYADCPLCGDRRGRLSMSLEHNVWRCFNCGGYGGMLALYGAVQGMDNKSAYHDIRDRLLTDGFSSDYEENPPPRPPQAMTAPPEEIHRTFSALLSMLTLTEAHRTHLREVRGLTGEQIERFRFRSTPPSSACPAIAAALLRQGCTLEGVPGFYIDKRGQWTIAFYSITAGFLIPAYGADGRIQGAQIRLDRPLKGRGDPSDKPGAKYIWLSSSGKNHGTSSGSPVFFAGSPNVREVYVTEGGLKACVAHCLTGRTFAATAGANNLAGLEKVFPFLARGGTELIVEAEDMDKMVNPDVARGAARVYAMARAAGMACKQLTWDPACKGIDDWQLALRRKKQNNEVTDKKNDREQGYRIYQINTTRVCSVPYAFRSCDEMREAEYRQPAARDYDLVYDGRMTASGNEADSELLEKIYRRFNLDLPEDYPGRSLSMSDVMELYDSGSRRYFYCDRMGFSPVQFSPMLVKPFQRGA